MKKTITLLMALSYSIQSLCIPGLKKAMTAKPKGLEAALEEITPHKYSDFNSIKELPELPSLPKEIIIQILLKSNNIFNSMKSIRAIELALSLINNFPDYTDEILIALSKNPNVELDNFERLAKAFCNTMQLKGITSFNCLMQNQIIHGIKTDQETDQENINSLNKAFRIKNEPGQRWKGEFELDALNSQIAVNNTELMKKSQQKFKADYIGKNILIRAMLQVEFYKRTDVPTMDTMMNFLIEKTILPKLIIANFDYYRYVCQSTEKDRLCQILIGRFIKIIKNNFEL